MLASLVLATVLEMPPQIRRQPYFGATITRPQQLGVFGGVMFALPGRPMTIEQGVFQGSGVAVEAEAALAGGKVSAGVFTVGGPLGASARVAALRTWGDPWAAASKRTYVGPEVTLQFAIFRVTAGYLHNEDGDLVTVGAGITFTSADW
jgi:hypothetical protein